MSKEGFSSGAALSVALRVARTWTLAPSWCCSLTAAGSTCLPACGTATWTSWKRTWKAPSLVSDGLVISAALDELLAHARARSRTRPAGSSRARLSRVARPPIADASPYVYTVHADDLVRIVLGIEDAGDDLVAIFHSHTNPGRALAHRPPPGDVPRCGLSARHLMDADTEPMQALRAWRISDGVATEVLLRIEP